MGRVGAAGDNAAMEMLLSVSSGHRCCFEESEQVSGVVPLQAAHRFALGLAFGDPAGLRACWTRPTNDSLRSSQSARSLGCASVRRLRSGSRTWTSCGVSYTSDARFSGQEAG